jgi:hypothetical protein
MFRNGVGAPIPMLVEPTQQNTQSQWTATSWSATQSQRVQGEEVEPLDEDKPSEDVPAVQKTESNQTTHPTLFCQPFCHGLPDPMSQRAPSNHLPVNWLPLRLKLGPTQGGALELLAKAAQ